jgi:alkylated DNA repair dioxygenase AlkB
MADAFQGSLLDLVDQAGPGPLGDSVRRRALAHGAWVDVRPGWLAGADELFGRLLRAVPWRAERRHMYDRVVDVPRLLCFYGEGEPLPDPALA